MATAEALLTAEEYGRLPDDGRPTELVRGRIVPLNMPAPRHGYVCNRIGRILGNHVEEHALGRVMNNDAGVITERDPDTVRGPDVAYYSYARLPPGPLPAGYLDAVPELVFEVLSPTDRLTAVMRKAAEYLEAGVAVVCVADPEQQAVQVCRPNQLAETFGPDQELVFPDVLGDFRVLVRRLFE